MMSTDKFANSDLGKNVINYATGDAGGDSFLAGTKAINGRDDFLWQPEAQDLEKVTGSFEGSADSFFQSYNQFDKVRTLGQETVRFCAPFPVSDKPRFVARCAEYLSNFNRDNLKWTCVVGGDSRTCMQMVKDGDAEITKFGGNELFTAYTEFDLEPVVAEIYEGTNKASYKAVAVMRRQDCEQLEQNLAPNAHPFAGLEGKKSCHTGYRKTAGWVLPVGTLFDLQLMPRTEIEGVQADAASVANFFEGVCAPGVTDEGPSIGGGHYQKLCALCENKQQCDKDDAYEGYEGALQCLINEEGDVAWVKHTTPLTRLPSEREDLRLLCPRTGSSTASLCREVDRWEDCSYADAPGHAWVGRPNWHSTVAGKAAVKSLEMASKDTFFLAFTTFDDFEDFPLQSSALRLEGVENPTNFEAYFGSEAFRAFSNIRGLDQAQGKSSEDSEDDGLTGGEIAGIVVAVVVGTPLIILIIVFIVKKRRGGDMSMDISMPKLKNPFRRTAPPNVGEGYKVYNPTMDFNGGRMPPAPADAVKV
uniref:Transferrin-like domain-containing protein n=2 Tax=Dunaliella tertiolecta TaxID=3047 RepID=A0A7S3QXX0_DUNTE|mmetsp:Transcript_12595/g.34432  ORF Transcript_12595/g.34432 Transcript_12595/m.34432 type:complete len:532 (+) Transcript_12595:933-2528(+)